MKCSGFKHAMLTMSHVTGETGRNLKYNGYCFCKYFDTDEWLDNSRSSTSLKVDVISLLKDL